MVIGDIFNSNEHVNSSVEVSSLPIASVSDRLLSKLLDFLIFSPVIALFTAMQLREVRTYLLTDDQSTEAGLVWVLFLVGVLGLSIFLQAVFVYFWSATPGQKFVHLHITSLLPGDDKGSKPRLRFSQALLRAIFWWGSLLLLAIPFLEVFTHPQRRSLHDRVADTVLVSKKRQLSQVPHILEQRFFSQIITGLSAIILMLGLVAYLRVYKMVATGFFKRAELVNSGALCEIPGDNNLPARARLDSLLALHFLDVDTQECLQGEANLALWSASSEGRSLAYLVKAILSENSQESKDYTAQLCLEFSSSRECELADWFVNPASHFPQKMGYLSKSEQALFIRRSIQGSETYGVGKVIEGFVDDETFRVAIQPWYVKFGWRLNELAIVRSSKSQNRQPASNENQVFLENFKKRFELQ